MLARASTRDPGARPPPLLARGHTVAETARSVGLPYATVRHWCRRSPRAEAAGTAFRCFRCRPGVGNPTDPPPMPICSALPRRRPPGRPPHGSGAAHLLHRRVAGPDRGLRRRHASRAGGEGATGPETGLRRRTELRRALAVPAAAARARQEARAPDRPGRLAADRLSTTTPATSCAACSTPTAAGSPTGSPCAAGATSIPATCSSTSRPTSWGSASGRLDLLGIAWRMNRRNSLSVARREAVAALDRHVGPKS